MERVRFLFLRIRSLKYLKDKKLFVYEKEKYVSKDCDHLDDDCDAYVPDWADH